MSEYRTAQIFVRDKLAGLLRETDENSGSYILSEAYDMLPVNTVNPADTEQTALTLNGKKRNLHRNDFLKFADACQIDRAVAGKIIDRMKGYESEFIRKTEQSYLTDELKDNLNLLITQRINDL